MNCALINYFVSGGSRSLRDLAACIMGESDHTSLVAWLRFKNDLAPISQPLTSDSFSAPSNYLAFNQIVPNLQRLCPDVIDTEADFKHYNNYVFQVLASLSGMWNHSVVSTAFCSPEGLANRVALDRVL